MKIKSGFTLNELLVATVLISIVGITAFTLFQTGDRHEARQQDILQQNHNLRAALHVLARDIRMAGNGLNIIGADLFDIYVEAQYSDPEAHENGSGWFKHIGSNLSGVRPIFSPEQTDSEIPDVFTIIYSSHENPLPIGRLEDSSPFSVGNDTSLWLQEPISPGNQISDGHMIAVVNDNRAVILQASFDSGANTYEIKIGDRHKPGSTLMTFPPGSQVYNLRDISFVTYYINNVTQRLMANHHYAIVPGATEPHLISIASNIENMKIAYILASLTNSAGPKPPTNINPLEALDRTINDGVLEDKAICMANISLLSHSIRPNKMGPSTETICWPGSTICYTTPNDGHTRRKISKNINIRNNSLGLCTAL